MTVSAKRAPARLALFSAVALTALGAMGGATLAPHYAHAEAPLNPTQMAPVGPASFADLVDRVKGAVVSVKVKLAAPPDEEGARNFGGDDEDPMERFFRRFGQGRGMPGMPGGRPRSGGQALGSGFIISGDGYVVTNNHVVENATDVELVLDGNKTVHAKVIGTDKRTDLALLKITEAGTYPFVQFGSKMPRVGDWVVAVGNPFGLGGTVTAGIVSARGRDIGSGPYDDYLQIDAPVNRGNSGGPTFDATGQVVGVNTAIYSPSGGSVGIGFAIPSEVAKDVIAALKDKGVVSRGYIGVQIQPVTQDIADSLGLKSTKGALVAEAKSGPAAEAGVKSGDVITAVNGSEVEGPRELSRKIAALGPNQLIKLTFMRGGAEKTVEVKLGELPTDKEARANKGVDSPGLSGYGLELAPAANVPGAGKLGVVVADIDPNGVAAQKGLRPGDVILDAAGKTVSTPQDVKDALATARKDGQKAILLRVKSGDGVRYVALSVNAG
ncbi:MAG: Do family serine endopeptidase [Hyphomicrobiales bacterium]|nr:Do family serine endopeptidase [Hyphomicrobiales bacterium]